MDNLPRNAANLTEGITNTGASVPTSASSFAVPAKLMSNSANSLDTDIDLINHLKTYNAWSKSDHWKNFFDPLDLFGWREKNAEAQKLKNERLWEAQKLQDQREWEEYMSNTAIQRRMQDLKAAGINPLLAVGSASSGASTPGAAASASGATSATGQKTNTAAALGLIALILKMIL